MIASPAPETFEEHILEIVDEFLQTVVVVDDRAIETSSEELASREPVEAQPRSGRGRAVTSLTAIPEGGDDHCLDAKAVTDAFAESGLVCSLLSPGLEEEVADKFLMAAKRADLIVLDWVLHKNVGSKTLELVEKVLARDNMPDRRRLRTIVVYTGQKELHDVADRLAKTIDAAYDDCELERDDDQLAMTKGPVRAAVFAKEHVSDLPSDLESRRVAFSELPRRLRGEFAVLTTGLVTGVALAALAALRDDTHRILKVLGPKLDPAYLGHRVALADPEEAGGQTLMLVAAEIRSVIEDNDVGRNVGLAVLELWLDSAKRRQLHFGELIDDKKRLTGPQVKAILSKGLGTKDGVEAAAAATTYSKNYFNDKVKPQATKIFSEDEQAAATSDADFAHRTMMRTVYSYPPRVLQLGTIVHADDKYGLCVQPLCDSVRVPETRNFPFLALEVVDPSGRPDFVVVDHKGPGWVHLRLAGNPRDLYMVAFAPDSGTVVATTTDDVHSFTDVDSVAHRWIGELKPDFAQRAAFDLAQQFARIAVDEAEIFRLARRG
jgi:hypothetical protein